jgi:hypothetical protein
MRMMRILCWKHNAGAHLAGPSETRCIAALFRSFSGLSGRAGFWKPEFGSLVSYPCVFRVVLRWISRVIPLDPFPDRGIVQVKFGMPHDCGDEHMVEPAIPQDCRQMLRITSLD